MKTIIYKHLKELPVRKKRILGKIPRLPKKRKYKDTAECLICGRDFIAVPTHVRQIHKLNLNEYKNRFGNVKVWGDDFKKYLETNGRIIGITDEAIKARTKYWDNPDNINNKSEWMVDEMKKRMKNPEFAKKWHNRKSLEDFTKEAREKFNKIDSLRKNCKKCGKEFKPEIFWNRGYWKHKQSGSRWDEKHYCSVECRYLDMKGKPKSKEHRLHLSLSHLNRKRGNDLQMTVLSKDS